ncbi:helix-turn-helix domain-containing protein [Edwardsiella ictaluri]|uniref:helix-turn-helix domain-containing protein n=1 Tax=Edwardsiella ictaluri TaxID=67780 RepID=UPI001CF19F0B|nr:helix-turn-helix domain-containing protein [Edwardsiella ictaluri]UCQ48545.1 helix-turn-helix domain-containing protein [Edwardsiella ictaluri]
MARYADLFGLSQRKFNQLFNEKFGMAPKRWLLRQRLGHARQLLETTSKKVIDVALESGFCNAAHFSDCFRRHFSQSPSEVRRASHHHRAA